MKRPALRKCLKSLDEVYTVSNYSMQHILSEVKRTKISLYYQAFHVCESPVIMKAVSADYILFVSGGRPLKNLSHALLGFSEYKRIYSESKIKLVITGIKKSTFNNLLKLPNLNKESMEKDILLLEYVSNEELAGLYLNCRFVLYTSKNEGFGLPVLEAASYGKTCVASNTTSVPEVIGSAVRYICPTDDCAIAREIAYLCDDNKLALYENRITEAMMFVKQRMRVEQKNFLEDLIEL